MLQSFILNVTDEIQNTLNCFRGKTMGGSSSINSMSYIRDNRKDYDDWAAMDNTGWSYEEVSISY